MNFIRLNALPAYPLVLTCLLLATGTAVAQEKLTEHTWHSGNASPPAAQIEDMAWFTGTWHGEGLGGFVEEIWSAPRGGIMFGMFRMLKDENTVFYELMILAEENGSLVLRLKHFSPDLTGWEEKGDFKEFVLVRKDEDAMHFDGLTFQKRGNDAATVYVAIEDRDGTIREEGFEYSRR